MCRINADYLWTLLYRGIARAGFIQNVRASNGWHSDITFEPVPSDYAVSDRTLHVVFACLLIGIIVDPQDAHTT